MKKQNVFSAILVLMFFGISLATAQPGIGRQGGGASALLNLTQEQEDQISNLRTTLLNETKVLKAELQEKKAAHHSLMIADDPNKAQIDASIDQITEILNQLMKERADHRQNVRSLLTEEQKAVYDTRKPRGPRQNFGRQGKGYQKGNRTAPNCPRGA